jgi:hypothetical protein
MTRALRTILTLALDCFELALVFAGALGLVAMIAWGI